MPFEFGTIVLVPFPFTDQTAAKQRPAVVISERTYNHAKPDLIVMAITSQLRPAAELGEVWLSGWEAAGLLKPSAVKPVVATLDQQLVRRTLGVLSSEDQARLRGVISKIIG